MENQNSGAADQRGDQMHTTVRTGAAGAARPDQPGAEWLTIREFAEAAGVTAQAVYKRFKPEIDNRFKTENGRKMVHIDALELFANAGSCQPGAGSCQPLATAELAALDALRDQISRQGAELTEQRQQLDQMRTELIAAQLDRERLTAELAAADQRANDAAERERAADQRAQDAAALAAERDRATAAQLAALADALTTAQKQAAELTAALAAAQSLHAGTIRGQLDSGRPADDQSDGAHSTVRTGGEARPDQPDNLPERRGLFARLFRRKRETR